MQNVDPAPASWIKVVAMLPTHPHNKELSQTGSLKKNNLVLIVFEILLLIKRNLGYNSIQLLSWEALPPTGEFRALQDINLKNILDFNREACSRILSNLILKSLFDNTVRKDYCSFENNILECCLAKLQPLHVNEGGGVILTIFVYSFYMFSTIPIICNLLKKYYIQLGQ